MMNHRGSLVVAAVLAALAPGCAAGRIGHIEFTESNKVCTLKAANIKVVVHDEPKSSGMAWVVSNQCAGDREVTVFIKEQKKPPLQCASFPITPIKVKEGEISAIACVVDASLEKGVYKFHYGVTSGNLKVDPDLIIKRDR